MQTLRRTRVGPFTAEQGIGVEATPEVGRAKLLPALAAFAHWPQVTLSEPAAKRFCSGQMVEYSADSELGLGYVVPVLNTEGEMLGIGEIFKEKRVAPEIVLAR